MPTTDIVDTIHRIDRAEWDALVGENVFESYGWLKTLEQTFIGDQKPRYFLMREEGRLIATAACYIAHPSEQIHNIDDTLLGRFKRYASKMGISFLPAVICAPRGAFGIHLSVGKHLDSKKAESAEMELIQTIEEFASEHRLPILFPNVMDHEISLIRSLSQRGYSKAVTFPLSFLDVEWSSFNDYLTGLKRISLNSAKIIRREINKNRNEGVVIEQLEKVDGCQDRIYELVNRNYWSHNGRPFPFRKEYFKALKENLGSDAVIYVATKKNELIGVCVLLRRKESYYLPVIGIDHESAGNDFTYFNLAYYQPIRDAISDRIKRIYYGQALYALKTRRGCKMSNTYTFYRPYQSVFQIAVKPWFLLLSVWYRKKAVMEVTQKG
ncbi:MAG: GNAT family N-acetyltransferase [Nitrospirae bacterium]|nr:GNAT family N-acetyltransferase [Nitrospirota bacterium]